MTEKMRWGVISTANIARAAVIPALQQAETADVIAVASRDLDRAEAFADRVGIPRAYGSYESLLQADDIEAVYIPLPNSLHHPWTIKAAESGKHILCEKPLALNAAECEEMEAAAKENGVRLMEAFMYRFHPQTEKVLDLLREGAIGAPRLIYAAFTFRLRDRDNIRLNAELGGGALMDVGCYCVNVCRTLAGCEPVRAQAFARWGGTGVDEQTVGTLEFEDGLQAQFSCGLFLERREFYQVAGPDGYLEVPSAFLPGTADTTIHEARGRGERVAHRISGVDEYQLMVEHFVECVRHDRGFQYPPSEAYRNMRAVEALRRSARNNGEPEVL